MTTVTYALEPRLDPAEMIDLLRRSTLAERRPIDEPGTIEGMIRNADILLTARVEGRLVGVTRAITDFSYCTYLSDLAVDQDYQRRGIGRELVRRTHEAAGLNTTLVLLAAPQVARLLSAYWHVPARLLLDHTPATPAASELLRPLPVVASSKSVGDDPRGLIQADAVGFEIVEVVKHAGATKTGCRSGRAGRRGRE